MPGSPVAGTMSFPQPAYRPRLNVRNWRTPRILPTRPTLPPAAPPCYTAALT